MIKRPKLYIAIIILCIIAFALSIIIEIEKHSAEASAITTFCSAVQGVNGCSIVQASEYSQILGIDNPIYGMVGFILLGALALISWKFTSSIARKLVIIGCIITGTLSSWFLYVQTFILHTYCFYCLIVDGISIILFIIGIMLLIKKK